MHLPYQNLNFHSLILLASTYASTLNMDVQRGPLWCYCTTCQENIRYCITDGGYCFKERMNDTFYEYGCWNREEALTNCYPSPNDLTDSDGNSLGPKTQCCHSHWCTINNDILDKSLNSLLDIEEEQNVGNNSNLPCYCDTCGVDSLCRTAHGKCYKHTIRPLSPAKYGCMPENRTNRLCATMFRGRIRNNFINHIYQCCDSSLLCNFDPDRLPLQLIRKLTWIKSLRFERLAKNGTVATYRILFRNTIMGDISISQLSMLSVDLQTTIITHMGKMEIELDRNVLYKFEVHPLIDELSLYQYNRTFYFARVIGFRTLWFPTDLHYDLTVYTLVLCKVCLQIESNLRCDSCESFNEENTNPLWVSSIF